IVEPPRVDPPVNGSCFCRCEIAGFGRTDRDRTRSGGRGRDLDAIEEIYGGHGQALPLVIWKAVIVNCWPAAKLMLSTFMSPLPFVSVTVPCIWQTVPAEFLMRKCPACPVASADRSCQVPAITFTPFAAGAIQSDGRLSVASTVPVSAAAQLAGGGPERISRIGDVPIVVSIASRRALRTATE